MQTEHKLVGFSILTQKVKLYLEKHYNSQINKLKNENKIKKKINDYDYKVVYRKLLNLYSNYK